MFGHRAGGRQGGNEVRRQDGGGGRKGMGYLLNAFKAFVWNATARLGGGHGSREVATGAGRAGHGGKSPVK